jgi:hypothetical protein
MAMQTAMNFTRTILDPSLRSRSVPRKSNVLVASFSSLTEKGVLFSAPVMDSSMMQDLKTIENSFFATTHGATTKPKTRVEKGLLFSDPCLSMCKNGEY